MAGSKTNYQCTKLFSLPSPGPPKSQSACGRTLFPGAFWENKKEWQHIEPLRWLSLVWRMLLLGSCSCSAENAGTLKAACLDCCRSLCWAKGHWCFGTTTSSSHPTTPGMPEDLPTLPLSIPPPITLPAVPSPPAGPYARFRLPSRLRKLEGLSFISANWMEYSWPFQWNQFTPCRDRDEVWAAVVPLFPLSKGWRRHR